jgi:hypothetical protein
MYNDVKKRYGTKQFFFFCNVPMMREMHAARFKKFIVANAAKNKRPAKLKKQRNNFN